MSFYSDRLNDSNEMIVAANTHGLGKFKPIVEASAPLEYTECALAYWQTMKETDGDTAKACDVLWQTLSYHGIDCPDKDELSHALYLESPYCSE